MPTPEAPINIGHTGPRWAGTLWWQQARRNVHGWLTRESMIDGYKEYLAIGPWRMKMYRHYELGIYVLTSERNGVEDWHSEYDNLTEARHWFVDRYNDICVELACEVLELPE